MDYSSRYTLEKNKAIVKQAYKIHISLTEDLCGIHELKCIVGRHLVWKTC